MRRFEVEVEARIIVPMEGPNEDSVMELAEEKLVGAIEEAIDQEYAAASGPIIIRRVQVETIEDVSGTPEKVS